MGNAQQFSTTLAHRLYLSAIYIYFQNQINYQSDKKDSLFLKHKAKIFLIWKFFALYLKQKGILLLA